MARAKALTSYAAAMSLSASVCYATPLSLDDARRDAAVLSIALAGQGVVDTISPLGTITEHLQGNVSFNYDSTGWTFGLNGTTTAGRAFVISDAASAQLGAAAISGALIGHRPSAACARQSTDRAM